MTFRNEDVVIPLASQLIKSSSNMAQDDPDHLIIKDMDSNESLDEMLVRRS